LIVVELFSGAVKLKLLLNDMNKNANHYYYLQLTLYIRKINVLAWKRIENFDNKKVTAESILDKSESQLFIIDIL